TKNCVFCGEKVCILLDCLQFDRKMDCEMKKKVNSFIKVSHLAEDASYGTACPRYADRGGEKSNKKVR
ncbi:MAG: hypothetical protein SOW80_00105, partial [Anaerovoracaceae bacterium]|nr:hypothetical protein [Anaerovoracaceae bacterium]